MRVIFGWDKNDLLKRSLEDFTAMLEQAGAMFAATRHALWAGNGGARGEIYRMDESLNRAELRIREQLFTHLSVNPGAGIFQSMVLSHLVRDAERLGDHCKYLVDVADRDDQWLACDTPRALLESRTDGIATSFRETAAAFGNSDEALARAVVERKIAHDKLCDELIGRVYGEALPKNAAVSLILINHNFKRLQAHLANIAASVLLPASRMFFYDKKMSEGYPPPPDGK